MSTRSYICRREGDHYIGVYCHHDGYLSHNGLILYTCYNDDKKVRDLITKDMSSLGDTLEECIFYDDEFNPPAQFSSLAAMNDFDIDYYYIWEKERWYVKRGNGRPILLEEVDF